MHFIREATPFNEEVRHVVLLAAQAEKQSRGGCRHGGLVLRKRQQGSATVEIRCKYDRDIGSGAVCRDYAL